MSLLLSTQEKVDKLRRLLETQDLDAREQEFVRGLVTKRIRGYLGDLSEKQINWMDDLYARHFA